MIHEYFHGKRMKIILGQNDIMPELDIGAGKKPKGRLTIDILARLRPDIVGVITALPLRAGSISSVVCSHVIEHTVDPGEAISEVKRVLSNGGVAFFFLPNDGSLLWRILQPFWSIYYNRFVMKEASPDTHISSFDYRTFSSLIGENFTVLTKGKMNLGMEMYAKCQR